MSETFEFIVIEEGNRGRIENGGSGYYDEVGIYFEGKIVDTLIVFDDTYYSEKCVKTNGQETYKITNDRLIHTKYGSAIDITESVRSGEYMPFARGAEYLVQEYQEEYKMRKKHKGSK